MAADSGEVGGRTGLTSCGELQLGLDTYRDIVRATLGGRSWLFRGLGVLLLVAGASSLVLVGADAVVGASTEIALGIALAMLEEFAARLGWRRLRPLTDRPWRYTFSTAGVGVRTPASDVSIGWEAVRRVDRRSRAWTVRTTTRGRLVIPRAAFTSEEAARIDRRLEGLTPR